MADSQTNGELEQSEPMETSDTVEHTENYEKLLELGIDSKVADELDKIYAKGLAQHEDLDDRALDALKEFDVTGAQEVLKEFAISNLEHVTNKSAYLCGVMKTYRQRTKNQGGTPQPQKGPDEAKLKEILDRTGYSLDITVGQRKYGGPPPDWEGPQPVCGTEVYVGKIPRDVFEDVLIPLFEGAGRIWDLRLMMDPLTGLNRGYAFVTYCDSEGAQKAASTLDGSEIVAGKKIKVNISVPNVRLFIGNIPKSKSKEDILEEFGKNVDGLKDAIVYSIPDDPKKRNRGFAFLEFETHKMASSAKRKLASGKVKAWGSDFAVDWADPQEEPDSETMSKVKVLYVRNLTQDVTEDMIKEKFEPYGKVERVKKIKDYAFVHFEERDPAMQAMNDLNQQKLGGSTMEVSLAKPQTENKKKTMRREADKYRMGRGYDDFFGMPPRGMSPRGRGRMGRGRMPYGEFYEDYYGSPDYGGGYAMDPYTDDFYNMGYDDGFGFGPRGGLRGRPMGRGRGMPRGRGLPGGRGMPRGRGRGGQVQRRGMGNSAARRAAGKRKAGGETGNQGSGYASD